MEGPGEGYVNGSVDDQAPAALQELQAAAQDVHAMPVVVGAFQDALAADPQGGAGTPGDAGLADGSTPGMEHLAGLSGGGRGGGRMSSSTFKNRSGPLYCQVESCGASLDNLKEYHQRYKVCELHLKIPYIVRDGQQVRFCQQCGRFQPLEDFDDNKRSCRVRLQRHNARRRKRPRDGGDHMDYGGMAGSAAAAAEMAKLAAYAPAGMPVSPKEIQAMQEALHFASTTLMHSQGKPAGEEGGEGEGGAVPMGPGSMPFVPAPDVMMLLLKGYAAMFHYALDAATLRALATPSDIPDQQAAAAASMGMGAIDTIQMQQLLQAQGLFAPGGLPLGMLPGVDAAGNPLQLPPELLAAAGGGSEEGGQEGGDGGEPQAQQQQEGQALGEGVGQLTAEQLAAALITHQQPTNDAGAAAAAAALAQAAYLTAGAQAAAEAGAEAGALPEAQQAGEGEDEEGEGMQE